MLRGKVNQMAELGIILTLPDSFSNEGSHAFTQMFNMDHKKLFGVPMKSFFLLCVFPQINRGGKVLSCQQESLSQWYNQHGTEKY